MTDEKEIINPQAEGSNAVFSRKGKEVVRSNHSEKLELIKSSLDNFQFSEITQEKIEKKINKTVESFGLSDVEKITMGMNSFSSNIPIIGMISSNVAIETVKMRYRKEANEKMPLVVKKLVNTAINDLEKQKKELVDNLTDLSKEVRERENSLL